MHLRSKLSPATLLPPAASSMLLLMTCVQVQGYVRAVGPQGVFVTLGRAVDARIRLSNLADTYVEDPAAAFVPGQLVRGTILSIDPARLVSHCTLKQQQQQQHCLQIFHDMMVDSLAAGHPPG